MTQFEKLLASSSLRIFYHLENNGGASYSSNPLRDDCCIQVLFVVTAAAFPPNCSQDLLYCTF